MPFCNSPKSQYRSDLDRRHWHFIHRDWYQVQALHKRLRQAALDRECNAADIIVTLQTKK
jgi:hypothetical protein